MAAGKCRTGPPPACVAASDNDASRRVAEAAGFAQAGTFTGDDGTEVLRYTRDAS